MSEMNRRTRPQRGSRGRSQSPRRTPGAIVFSYPWASFVSGSYGVVHAAVDPSSEVDSCNIRFPITSLAAFSFGDDRAGAEAFLADLQRVIHSKGFGAPEHEVEFSLFGHRLFGYTVANAVAAGGAVRAT